MRGNRDLQKDGRDSFAVAAVAAILPNLALNGRHRAPGNEARLHAETGAD